MVLRNDMTWVALLQLAYRLAVEINSGMKFRQSTLAIVQRIEINGERVTSARTKKAALADLVSKMQELNPSFEISSSLARALAR